jgi:hypothetical protein
MDASKAADLASPSLNFFPFWPAADGVVLAAPDFWLPVED